MTYWTCSIGSTANDEKIGELQEKVIGKLEEHDVERRQEAEEVKKTIERILQAKKSIGALLSSLPPITPMQRIIVDGTVIDVNHILNVDE